MKNIIISEYNNNFYISVCNSIINPDIKINNKIFGEELIEYKIEFREELINLLIGWISEENNNKEAMKEDLKYLINLKDNFILSSICINEYVAKSDNEEKFNEICEDILKINKEII